MGPDGEGWSGIPLQGDDILWHSRPKYQNVCDQPAVRRSVTEAKPQPSEKPNQTTSQTRDEGQGFDLVSKSLATHAHQGFSLFLFAGE